MRCYKCGNTLPDDSLFCQFCGAELHQPNVCPDCGALLTEEYHFCTHCGRALLPSEPTEATEETPSPKKEKNSQARLLLFLIVAIGLGLSILVFAVIALFSRFDWQPTPKRVPEPAPKPVENMIATPADAAGSVLYLEGYDSTGDLVCQGSGFLAMDSCTLVTNYHVINNVYSFRVFYPDGNFAADVSQVLTYNSDQDLAVLELSEELQLPPLPLGDSDPVRQGDAVYAIGYPLGASNTLSDGIISSVFTNEGVEILQVTAPVSSGSSGGPLLDKNCQVIGIVTSTLIDGQNMNMSVAVSELHDLLAHRFRTSTLAELYTKSHPQLTYDSYRVGLRSLRIPSRELADEIYDLWLQIAATEDSMTKFVYTYDRYEGCIYDPITQYVSPGMWGKTFDAWCFDVDRNFGDVFLMEEKEGFTLYFFYSTQEEVTEQEPKEKTEAAEPPAEPAVCSHVWNVQDETPPSGCTQPGQKTLKCTLCDYTEVQTIAAKGHTEQVITPELPATCTTDGMSKNSICSVCNTVLSSPTVIPKLGHAYDADGFCSVCFEKDPALVTPLSQETLQGKWTCTYGLTSGEFLNIIFTGNHYYWDYVKDGPNIERVALYGGGRFEIDGMSIIFSDGGTEYVEGISDTRLFIAGMTFSKRY